MQRGEKEQPATGYYVVSASEPNGFTYIQTPPVVMWSACFFRRLLLSRLTKGIYVNSKKRELPLPGLCPQWKKFHFIT